MKSIVIASKIIITYIVSVLFVVYISKSKNNLSAVRDYNDNNNYVVHIYTFECFFLMASL